MLSERDQHDLRWLEIGQYVAAAYMLVMGVGAWIFMRMLAPVFDEARSDPALEFFDVFFAAMTVGWCLAGLAVPLGSALLIRRRKCPTALVVLSAIHCVFVPLGTAAGIFAIILVRRPSIHAAFTGASYHPPQEPETSAPPSAKLTSEDVSQLRTLAAVHRVVGLITGLFALVPMAHLFLGLSLVSNPPSSAQQDASLETIGWFFSALALLLIVAVAALAFATLRAADFIERRTRWTFCIVVAAIQCTFFPFGTALGIFSLVVLNRERIRRTFEAA